MSIPTIEEIFGSCIESGASDIHISVGVPVMLRLNTELIALDCPNLNSDDVNSLIKSLVSEDLRACLDKKGSVDSALEFQGFGRFRVAIFRQMGKNAIAIRRISDKILSFDQIGLPKSIETICSRPRGLFLITGPTNSGKTTTLISCIDYINRKFPRHIITVEDPVEFRHTHKKSLVHQREIGIDTPDFPEALRSALRQDPDVLMVGEMRDIETMRAVMTAAETGRLVLATLHTLGTASAINRIIDAFPATEQENIRVQLAGSLIGVLSQTLCPRIDKPGMAVAFEYLYCTVAVQSLIRKNRPFSIDGECIQTGAIYGMQLLDDHLFQLYKSGIISADTAIERSKDPREMTRKIG